MNVTDLSQSKALKAMGAPQDTDIRWRLTGWAADPVYLLEARVLSASSDWTVIDRFPTKHIGDEEYASYDLESLIGWLPMTWKDSTGKQTLFWMRPKQWYDHRVSSDWQLGNGWECGYSNTMEYAPFAEGNTPLEAVYELCSAVYGGKDA